MSTFNVKVKEENDDIYLYDEVTEIAINNDEFKVKQEDGRSGTHLLDFTDEITIKKNL